MEISKKSVGVLVVVACGSLWVGTLWGQAKASSQQRITLVNDAGNPRCVIGLINAEKPGMDPAWGIEMLTKSGECNMRIFSHDIGSGFYAGQSDGGQISMMTDSDMASIKVQKGESNRGEISADKALCNLKLRSQAGGEAFLGSVSALDPTLYGISLLPSEGLVERVELVRGLPEGPQLQIDKLDGTRATFP